MGLVAGSWASDLQLSLKYAHYNRKRERKREGSLMGEVGNLPSFEIFSFVFVENCIDPGSGEKYVPNVYGRPDCIMIDDSGLLLCCI